MTITEPDCRATDTPECAVVEQLIQPRDKDLGGFSVRRCLTRLRILFSQRR